MLCAPDEGPVEDRSSARSSTASGGWVAGEEGVDFISGTETGSRYCGENGFEVEALGRAAPRGAQDHFYYEFVPAEWARKWPAEDAMARP
jgi:hypothetical protein